MKKLFVILFGIIVIVVYALYYDILNFNKTINQFVVHGPTNETFTNVRNVINNSKEKITQIFIDATPKPPTPTNTVATQTVKQNVTIPKIPPIVNLNPLITNTTTKIQLTTTTTPSEPNAYFLPKGQDVTTPINISNFLKELPKNGCTPSTNLLIATRTSPTEFKGREWIRNNWGKVRSQNVPLIFLIGTTKNQSVTMQIKEEQEKFGDILIMNFEDHYRNLTLKNYGLFKYFVDQCPNANCLAKPDVDSVANINGLEKFCNLSSVEKKLLSCYVIGKPPVIRDPGNKWYVPWYVYPNANYDVYAAGWGWILTGKNSVKDFIAALINKSPFLTSENWRRLPDDAVMTGDVRLVANIAIEHNSGFGIGAVTKWTDPSTNESIPLMSDAGGSQEPFWQQYQQIFQSNKLKKFIKSSFVSLNATKADLKPEQKESLNYICTMLEIISQDEAAKFGDLKKLCLNHERLENAVS